VQTSGFTPADLVVHLPRLRRYARALTGNREAADDLTQDTLERAWVKRALWRASSADAASSLRAWLFAVMHNVFVNGIRRARPTESLDAMTDSAPELEAAEISAETGAVVRDVQSALLSLPQEQRAVVLLVGLEQLTYAEAAYVLEVPIGTVMSRLSRGRERLRQVLGDDRPGASVPAGPASLRRVK